MIKINKFEQLDRNELISRSSEENYQKQFLKQWCVQKKSIKILDMKREKHGKANVNNTQKTARKSIDLLIPSMQKEILLFGILSKSSCKNEEKIAN